MNKHHIASRACVASRVLINQSAQLITGSGVACAVHRDQIEKSKEIVRKSREQIARLHVK